MLKMTIKTKHFLIAAMMLWNLLCGQDVVAQDWANKVRYALANQELLANHGHTPANIVMMGNSITEYWEELHPQFFVDHGLVCRGISGQVSSQMLARFRQDVLNLKPRIVVINCGTNDIAENNGPYDEDITMDNIMSMTELARSHGIQVILSSVLPTDGFGWNPGVKDIVQKINHLNQRIVDYCHEQRLPYINYHESMTSNGSAMTARLTDDGVHPNSAGYDIMEVKLLDMLARLNQHYNQQQ